MDTSHLAEHAGTAGTLFASVFVVATTTMRTMIPLRVFAILTNIVLIATAIPGHNYLVILVQSVVLVLNTILREKLRNGLRPDVLINPPTGDFGPMDFTKAASIIKTSEPAKDHIKRQIEEALEARV